MKWRQLPWPGPMLILTVLLLQTALATTLTPDDDWVAAIQAGGTVVLGPGEYSTDRVIEVTRSVTVTGAGHAETILLLESDGGDYREQFAVFAEEAVEVRAIISSLTFVHGSNHVSDLISVNGMAHVELRDVGVGLAFDDLQEMLEGNGNWWGCGVLVTPGASLVVEAGYFYGNVHGICAVGAAQVSVAASSFVENVLSGLHVEDTPVTVDASHFEANNVGIEIYGTASRSLTGNTFAEQSFQDIIEEE